MLTVNFKNDISAQVLLDYGAENDGSTDSQGPALHIAAWQEFPTMVRFLLDRGANPDARGHFEDFDSDAGKCTALHIAVFNGNYGIAKQLLQAYADVTGPFRMLGLLCTLLSWVAESIYSRCS